jgi:hypothetical protein
MTGIFAAAHVSRDFVISRIALGDYLAVSV